MTPAHRISPDRIVVRVEGDWDVVQSAVEAGAQAAEEVGQLVAMHVIPRPEGGASDLLPYRAFLDRYHSSGGVAKALPKKPKPKPPVTKATGVKAPAVQSKMKPAHTPQPLATPAPSPVEAQPSQLTAGQKSSSIADLETMSVVKLRKFARGLEGLPIQGREISMANKQQLLEAIRTLKQFQS